MNCKICNYDLTNEDLRFRDKQWYEYCWGCYHAEYNKKYYGSCVQCKTTENKAYLKSHEGLCGKCSGEIDEYCPTCGSFL